MVDLRRKPARKYCASTQHEFQNLAVLGQCSPLVLRRTADHATSAGHDRGDHVPSDSRIGRWRCWPATERVVPAHPRSRLREHTRRRAAALRARELRHALRGRDGPVNAVLHSMKYLKKIILISSLISMLGGCFVETQRPRYARRMCAYGWYWDGYGCHRYHRW
jgi:hypothetical protein